MSSWSLKRKLEDCLSALAVFQLLFMFFMGPILASIFSLYVLFFSKFYPLIVLYAIWIYVDRKTPYREGRRIKWVRNSWVWKYYEEYFPQRLVKTAELPSCSNYILATFPHGLICSGAFAQIASDRSPFARQFPGLRVSGHTLDGNFLVPFTREYCLAIGFYSASKEAILYQLSRNCCGMAANIVVGGSAEAMLSQPSTNRLVLKNRKGFVRLALISGASLVPVYNFGEVELYDQVRFPRDSLWFRIQNRIRKCTGAAPCIFRGVGPLGIFPRRSPVITVVGKPIAVSKVSHPSQQEVDDLHAKFMQELTQLFEEHKQKYLPQPDTAFLSIEDGL